MATSEIYTLSLHDALPISRHDHRRKQPAEPVDPVVPGYRVHRIRAAQDHEIGLRTRAVPERSEEHTSELQSLTNLVCRLLLEKKKDFALNDAHCSGCTWTR